jgi:hypothetical protein
MKLQRYFEPEIQEKSWTWIGFSALFPWVTAKVISDKKELVEVRAFIISFLAHTIETIATVKQETFDEIRIHINSLPQYKNFGAKFYRTEMEPYNKHSLFAVSKLLIDVALLALSNPHNIGFLPLFIGLPIDIMEKLSFSKKHEINYTNLDPMRLGWPFDDEDNNKLNIKWVGEADKDGYCQCVIVDEQGNTHDDIYLSPFYTTCEVSYVVY